MAKKLIYNYTFDASARTLTIRGKYALRNFVLITNVTDQSIIYNFADTSSGGTVSYNATTEETTLTLEYNTTAMSDSDEIQILLDDGQDTKIDAGESLLDPVHKFRVSTPENLIDTDFEYGLQPTKWETIELVDNIPSVYTRASGVSIGGIVSIITILNSDIITVTTSIPHDLGVGDPIEVQGTSSRSANGKYVVTSTPSTTKFLYRSREVQGSAGNIRTAYTTIIPGAFFTSSSIRFDSEQGIVTDGSNPSTLTITTPGYKHGLSTSTSVYLTNTVGKKEFTVTGTSSNAADGSPVIDTSNSTLYLPSHNLYTGQRIYVYPGAGGVLPTAVSGAPEPNTTETIDAVWTNSTNAIENIISTLESDNADSVIVHNNTNSTLYYTQGTYTSGVLGGGTANKIQYLVYGDGANATWRSDDLILYNAASNVNYGTWRFFPYNASPGSIYTGETIDLGARYALANGPDGSPATASGMILQRNTKFEYLASTQYILQVTQIRDPSLTNSNAVIQYWRTQDSYSKYGNYGSHRSYDTEYTALTKQPLGNGWQYAYATTEIEPIFGSYIGYIGGTIYLENTNWNAWYNNNVNLRNNYPYTIGLSHYNFNAHGGYYMIKYLIPYYTTNFNYITRPGYSNVTTRYTYTQIAESIVQEVANNLAYGQWSNTAGINTSTASIYNSDRITLNNSAGLPFSFSNSGQGPIQIETDQIAGVHDNYYSITGVGDTTVSIETTATIPARQLDFNNNNVFEYEGDFYIKIPGGHGLIDGTKVTFSVVSGSAPSGLTDGNNYWSIVNDDSIIRLSSSYANYTGRINALTGVPGSASEYKLYVFTISGRVESTGSFDATDTSKIITGNNTKFASNYKIGDSFSAVSFGSTVNTFQTRRIVSIVSDTSLTLDSPLGFTTTGAPHYVDTRVHVRADGTFLHRPFDGGVEITAGKSPDSTIVRQTRKYFRYQSGKGIQCSLAINFNPARPINTVSGSSPVTATMTIEYPHGLKSGNSVRISGVEEAISYTPTSASYNATTGDLTITINSHGFSVGEEISIAENSLTFTCALDGNASNHSYPRSTDPAGRNVRLGIKSVTTNTFVVYVGGSPYTGSHSFVSASANAVTHYNTDNPYNGIHTVTGATDFTFTYLTSTAITDTSPSGYAEYAIQGYSNAGIRCGLFDFQNGFFFEYDGSNLYVVRRSSVQQLSGTCTVTNGENIINGTNTIFLDQLSRNDRIVVRGQTYKVTSVESQTQIHVQPSYRGTSNSGVVITRTVDTRVPQSSWNIDKADGTGPSGYILDINKIQMAYMDYSWYGAGKIRFGFKDTYGHVKYMHEFIHNNRLNEAYMRTGNVPARYEAFNKSTPTFIPSLFHWGTSVIMDGGFDNDDSYLFTASGNTLTFTNGDAETATTTGSSILYSSGGRRYRDYYVGIPFSSADASKFSTGIPLYTADGTLNGQTVNFTQYGSGSTFYVYIYISSGYSAPSVYPSVAGGTTVNIGAETVGTTGVDLSSNIPLISVRLAPSADNNLIGELGERDIVNRMQLKLQELGISVSHDANISVILNGSLSNLTYSNVGSPSLSQYVAHQSGDTVDEGITIYQFRASGGATDASTGKRLVSSNAFDLSQLTDLGNSILGGDGVFPNGPDIITICASVINTADIDSTSAFQVASRISWSESQA